MPFIQNPTCSVCRRLAGWLLLAAVFLLAGCGETKYVLRFDTGQAEGAAMPVWPPQGETARYRYVGQLTGEDNLVAQDGDKRGAMLRMFYWLVGLAGFGQDKITLKRPQSGMTDGQGRIYVSDVSSHAVFVFDQGAGKLDVWTMAQEYRRFVTPIGIAAGPAGQILVADAELGEVFRLDHNGKPAGSFGRGILNRPTGLARDAARGRIYVSDTHAHDIKVFDDDGQLVETIGRRGDDEAGLNFPTHLAFAGGRLYVSDSMNARVQVFDGEGNYIRSVGRRGLYYGNLTRPKGVAVDGAGNLYVVESYYDHLLVFNAEGRFLMPIGGTGSEVGQFYLPSGVWSDAGGRIYVADMFNGRVVIFQFLGG